jgi:hypothetical protein
MHLEQDPGWVVARTVTLVLCWQPSVIPVAVWADTEGGGERH